MAVDSEAKKLWAGGAWAATGDRADPDDSSISPVLSRTIGFPASYSTTNTPARTRINQILRELSGAAIEVRNGVSGYDDEVRYPVNAIVQHGGVLWRADVVHDPASPVTPAASGQSTWTAMTGSGASNIAQPNSIPNNDILIDNDDASQFAVYWNAPSDNGSPITSYAIRYSKSASFASGVFTISPYTQGDAITANVDAGRADEYYVQVRATNGQGTPDWPTTNGKRVRVGAVSPEAITYFHATPGNGQVVLNWQAPYMHGLSLKRYIIEWKSGNQDFSTNANPARHRYITDGSIATTITGLTNGIAYDFRIAAESTRDTSTQGNFTTRSTPSSGVTISPPDQAINMMATPGLANGSIFVSTSEIPNDNGSKITSFQWQLKQSTSDIWLTPASPNSASTNVPFNTFTGLADVDWDFRMRAINNVNSNPDNWSALVKSNPFYPSVPDAPIIAAEGRSTPSTGGGVLAYITQDIAENGGTITLIEWQRRLTSNDENDWVTFINSGLNYATSRDETAGNSIDFRARAKNSAGNGAWSNVATVSAPGTVPGTLSPPDAPNIGVFAFEGSGRFMVAIQELTDDNNADITRYIWQSKLKTAGSDQWANITPIATDNQPYKISENGAYTVDSVYQFRAFAVNASGTSPVSNIVEATAVSSVGAPGVPDTPRLGVNILPTTTSSTNAFVIMYFERTLDDNNAPIQSFDYESKRSTDTTWTTISENNPFPFYIWQGADNGVTWDFRARATNSEGDSEYSNVVQLTTNRITAPTAPPRCNVKSWVSGSSANFTITNFANRFNTSAPQFPEGGPFTSVDWDVAYMNGASVISSSVLHYTWPNADESISSSNNPTDFFRQQHFKPSNGDRVRVRVRLNNLIGNGVWSFYKTVVFN